MMRLRTVCRLAWLVPALSVAACAGHGDRRVTNLDQRMQVLLAPDIAAGRVGLEPLPDGSRVTLPQQSLFPVGRAELGDNGRFLLASVIQGLIDPGILHIEIAEAPGTPVGLQTAQAQAVSQFFVDYGLGPSLQPAAPPQDLPPGAAAMPPPGVVITVNVVPG
jgi:hypothetical protein